MAENIGRLSAVGISAAWQVPLYLPRKYADWRLPETDFARLTVDQVQFCQGRVLSYEVFSRDLPPRMVLLLQDDKGASLPVTIFGDTRSLQKQLNKGDLVGVEGKVGYYRETRQLRASQMITAERIGTIEPVYTGKEKVITPETVAARITELLPQQVPVAARWIKQQIAGSPRDGQITTEWIERLLWQAHRPEDVAAAELAQRRLEQLSAYARCWDIKRCQWRPDTAPITVRLQKEDVRHMGFVLTDDQRQAIREIAADLRCPIAMRRLLSGDVGTGKTAVYGLVARAVVRDGGRVAVMLPNEALAQQIAADMRLWFPDVPCALITGAGVDGDLQSPLLVGTTALLHLKESPKVNLVVIDEQQKFSREQREQLTKTNAHLLEVTATCLPRSQALMQYGIMETSRLRQCPVKKTIETRLWRQDSRRELFDEIRQGLVAGEQLLVVYPRKREGQDSLPSVEDAYEQWNRAFPGQVAAIHSEKDGTEKADVLAAMRNREISILIATTVVEVGINIEGLRRVMVVHPEFLGLSTLHQIRGRVARKGGEGCFDLYCPKPISENAEQRMSVLVKTCDGFEVAAEDARIRGIGDLRADSSLQSGSDASFLIGRKIDPAHIEAVMNRWNEVREAVREESLQDGPSPR